MKRLNFDSLKNLEVPKPWIENALSVPAKHNSKAYSFLNFSRVASVVACFVLVCVTSFSVFLFMNGNGSIPVSSQSSTADTTEEIQYTKETNTSVETNSRESKVGTIHSEAPLILPYSTQIVTEKTNSSDISFLATEPTETIIADSDLPPQETGCAPQTPVTTQPIVATVPTTQHQTTIPKTQPTTTQPLVIISTTSVAPTYGWEDLQSVGICYGNFSKSLLVGNVYCRLYDVNGKLVGDSNLYSSQHLAHYIIESGDKVYVQYLLEKTDLKLKSGTYSYYFYNANGDDLYQGNVKMY